MAGLVAGVLVLLAGAALPSAASAAQLLWSAPQTIDGYGFGGVNMSAVSCPSPGLCVAVDVRGNAVVSTNPTAGSWSTSNIDGTNLLRGVSCPSVSLCVAVDSAGNVLTSTNPTGGSGAWARALVDSNGLDGVSCPSTALCVAVSSTGDVVTSVAPTVGDWSISSLSPTQINGMWQAVQLNAVSCGSVSFCVAVGNGVLATSTNPAGGAGAWTIALMNLGAAVSCPSTSLCVAADSYAGVVTSSNPTGGAGTWTATSLPTGISGVGGVACASVSLCVALSGPGAQFTDVFTSTNPTGGVAAWQKANVPGLSDYASVTLSAASCPTAGVCVVVGEGGLMVFGSVTPLLPTNTTAPVVIVTPFGHYGIGLHCYSGNWAATGAVGYTYLWLRDGHAIAGSSGFVYQPGPADFGHVVACKVTATNSVGSASATSPPVNIPGQRSGGGPGTGSGAPSVHVRCKANAAGHGCTITLTMTIRETISGHRVIGVSAANGKVTRKVVVVGTRKLTLGAGQSKTVPLKLNRTGQQLLAQRHKLRVKLKLAVVQRGHVTVISSRTITFHRNR